MTTNEKNAAATYAARASDIARLLDVLEMELQAHRSRARHRDQAQREGATWPMAGDLGKVRSDLIETLVFLSGREREDIETFLAEAE